MKEKIDVEFLIIGVVSLVLFSPNIMMLTNNITIKSIGAIMSYIIMYSMVLVLYVKNIKKKKGKNSTIDLKV